MLYLSISLPAKEWGNKRMKKLYFDCFSGISGDMVIGALIDAGADPLLLSEELRKLKIDEEYELTWQKVIKNGISSTKFDVVLKHNVIHDDLKAGHEHESHHGHSSEHHHHHDQTVTITMITIMNITIMRIISTLKVMNTVTITTMVKEIIKRLSK